MENALKPMTKVIDMVLAVAPKIALVLAILLVGFVLAALAKRLTRWAVQKSGLEAAAERAGIAKLLYTIGARRGLAHLIGTVVLFCGLLFCLFHIGFHTRETRKI